MGLNRAVYLNTLRWFLSSPARIIACVLFVGFAYSVLGGAAHMSVNGMDASSLLTPGTLASAGDRVLALLAWILGVGVVRREVLSGSAALVLTRPLTRASYVLSKWAAVSSLLLAFLLFCHGVLFARGVGSPGDPAEAGLVLAQCVQALALAAVVVLFSSLPTSFGEIGLLLTSVVALLIVGHYGDKLGWPALAGVKDVGFRVLFPRVRQVDAVGNVFLPGAAGVDVLGSLCFNAAVAAGALALGWLALERREFGYSEAGA